MNHAQKDPLTIHDLLATLGATTTEIASITDPARRKLAERLVATPNLIWIPPILRPLPKGELQ